MLSASPWMKFVLNAAFACLVVFIAIAVAVKAIAKQSKPAHALIEIKSSPPLLIASREKAEAVRYGGLARLSRQADAWSKIWRTWQARA